jgi:plastocyanin
MSFRAPAFLAGCRLGITAGVAMSLALSGCAGSSQAQSHPSGVEHSAATAPTTAPSNAPVSAVATNSVSIKNFAFSPSRITVKPGTKVTWVNHDEDAHTVSFQSSLKVSSNPLQGNQSFSYTFEKPGTYNYICSIHPFMHGTVIVANA